MHQQRWSTRVIVCHTYSGQSKERSHVNLICPAYISSDSFRYVLSPSAAGVRCARGSAFQGTRNANHGAADWLGGPAKLLLPSGPYLGGGRRPPKCSCRNRCLCRKTVWQD